MRGDFSAWNKDRGHNFRGTLHQQGRVLLDRDWNAQTEITGEWQETAARDAFGAGVAAVPADAPLSFKVLKAEIVASQVKISLTKGRLWADGLLVELEADDPALIPPPDADAIRTATYMNPPPGSVADLPNDQQDAVILETWLEELSPFQDPNLLIEPALGGVDTTERVQTAYRFRLFRMAAGETCDSIIDQLKDDFSAKGKLKVELKPTTAIDGDCPVVEGGGFTGFEHRLYRVEIADTDRLAPEAYFKWSHFNGGLVGTGDFDAVNKRVNIFGNKNAILYSGLKNFYLEALDYDASLGYWKVVYGAKAVQANDNTLALPDPAITPGDIFKGAIPPAPPQGRRFFRLWNGIERVDAFKTKTDLPDNLGIQLTFGPEGPGQFTPSDFWTFEVRAGEIGNPQVLIPNLPPQGIFYHRVPVAEVHWTSNSVTGDDLEDCRRPFQPLTKLKTCCTYRVGDGVHSHGDFKKVQDAINALPKTGGEVCILPGRYEENVVLQAPHNRNVILSGCGPRTVIKAPTDKPGIYVQFGQGITIESLAVEAHDDGIGILLEGEELTADGEEEDKYLKDIVLSQLSVRAVKNNAIKGSTAQTLALSNSVIHIQERERFRTRKPAVYLEGDDMLIERNEIRVLSSNAPDDDTALTDDPNRFVPAQQAAGGLQIGGGSERVRIINNLISGGIGNGISLGRIDLIKDGQTTPGRDPFDPKGVVEDWCNPDDGHEDDGEENDGGFAAIAGPPLYDILIKFNRIFNMGRNGIGVATFFSMGDKLDLSGIALPANVAVKGSIVISKLVILENRIALCMNIPPQPIPDKLSYLMGYGGIALGFVDGLVIRDNFIVDNCQDCRDPICGIYVLAATALDISRNEITEHLPQNFDEINPGSVKIGPRGGIWISIAMGQLTAPPGSAFDRLESVGVFRQFSGAQAARIEENVVSTPLGRGLTLMILGDAAITGNRFTSLGIQPVDLVKLLMAIFVQKQLNMSILLQVLGLLAGNVLVLDLGSFQLVGLVKAQQRDAKLKAYMATPAGQPGAAASNVNDYSANYGLPIANMVIRGGLIQFSSNQCNLVPSSRAITVGFSSILIVGVADVGFHNNQTSCNLPRSLLVTNAALAGGTLRATGNWLKETLGRVGVSAITGGVLNVTSDNESVHCLSISGALYLDRYNLVLSAFASGVLGSIAEVAEDGQEGFCRKQRGLASILTKMLRIILSDQAGTNAAENFRAMGIQVRTTGGG